jgi:hypothetical protein
VLREALELQIDELSSGDNQGKKEEPKKGRTF